MCLIHKNNYWSNDDRRNDYKAYPNTPQSDPGQAKIHLCWPIFVYNPCIKSNYYKYSLNDRKGIYYCFDNRFLINGKGIFVAHDYDSMRSYGVKNVEIYWEG